MKSRRAEEAGYRLGRSIGRLLAQKKSIASQGSGSRHNSSMSVIRHADISSDASSHVGTASALVRSFLGPERPFGRGSLRPNNQAAHILGAGFDLPFTRPLLRGLIGILEAEILLAGVGLASLMTLGSPADPLHVSSAVFGLASPLLQIALTPLMGPVLADAALTLAGIGLVWLAASSRRSARRQTVPGMVVSALPAEPIAVPVRPRRLIAAG